MSWFFLQHKLCNFYPELMTLSNLFLVNQKQHDQCNLIPKHMILMNLHFLVNQKPTASPVKFDSQMNDFCEPIIFSESKNIQHGQCLSPELMILWATIAGPFSESQIYSEFKINSNRFYEQILFSESKMYIMASVVRFRNFFFIMNRFFINQKHKVRQVTFGKKLLRAIKTVRFSFSFFQTFAPQKFLNNN